MPTDIMTSQAEETSVGVVEPLTGRNRRGKGRDVGRWLQSELGMRRMGNGYIYIKKNQ